VDADPFDLASSPVEDTGPRTHIHAPTPEQRSSGSIAAFVYRGEDGWTAIGTISKAFRGLTINHLEVDPAARNGTVTARMLRDLPLSEILAAAAASEPVLEALRQIQDQAPPEIAPEMRRPGRAPIPDETLRRVAELYLEETAPGKERGAVTRVAAQMDEKPATISRWVFMARKRGWLGPATPGREGGVPGPLLMLARMSTAEAEARRRPDEF
jgi:hypothetical protein